MMDKRSWQLNDEMGGYVRYKFWLGKDEGREATFILKRLP
jgi:hypothetical protein